MRFGPVNVGEAQGEILAHGVGVAGLRFKKGRVLSAEDVAALADAGVTQVITARLDTDDIGEDEAAAALARAASGPSAAGLEQTAAFTGRANLYATAHGLVLVDAARVDAANLIDEAVTIATVAPFEVVAPRRMLATAKIIPFAAPRASLDAAIKALEGPEPAVRVAPFRDKRIGLVSTRVPGMKESLLDKNRQALDERLGALSGHVVAEARVAHDAHAVGEALRAMIAEHAIEIALVFGGSAITDRRDVVPAGVEAAGGEVLHFGMPVDPGNLLLLGRIDAIPAVGLPGCARSPKLNGFDFVLQRLLAEVPVSRADIMRMGAGGLLKEIPTRPQRRDGPHAAAQGAPSAPRVGAVLLAAGMSRRMGAQNKLLVEIDGVPLVRRAAQALVASHAAPVVVVTGADREAVETALTGMPVRYAHNHSYARGMAGSIGAGLTTMTEQVEGVLIALGDMPCVAAEDIDRLIAAFNPTEGREIVAPVWNGRRGNPVLWARRFFAAILALDGDIGARELIAANAEALTEVAIEHDGCLVDLDTPEAVEAYLKRDAGREP